MRALTAVLTIAVSLAAGAHADAQKAPCAIEKLQETALELGTGGILQIPARIGSEPVNFFIDTGAPYSLLDQAIADRLNLPREMRMGHYIVGASGAPVAEAATVLRELQIGDATIRNVPMRIALSQPFSTAAHGLLGWDFLNHYDFEFDVADRKLRFFRRSHCAGSSSGAVYWSDRSSQLPIDLHSDHIVLRVTLDGQELSAILDSGASRTTVSWDTAHRLGITEDSPAVMKLRGTTQALGESLAIFAYRFHDLRIAGETIRQPILSISKLRLDGVDMLLGADFLAAHRTYIATGDQMLYFTWNGRMTFAR